MTDWDPRADHVGILDLVEIDTLDGPFRFLLGVDGLFTDINGNDWAGSQLLTSPQMQSAIEGIAPAGQIVLPFFQDPDEDDLIGGVKSLGRSYIDGQEIRFYYQPLLATSDFYAPQVAPVLEFTRICRELAYSGEGAERREITLFFEATTEDRASRRRIAMNTDGHSKLLGTANPSLEFMPTVDFEEEKLFG